MQTKFLLYIIVVILVIAGIAGASWYFVIKQLAPLEEQTEEQPFDDSDLRLPAVEIPEEENAYFPLVQAAEKIYWPKEKEDLIDKISTKEEWDSEFVKELIKKNEETFYYFDQALSRPRFQDPEFQNPEEVSWDTPLPDLGNWRKIAKLSSINALYLFKQGKEKEAFDEAIKIVKLGQMIENSPRQALIQYLVGMAIKGIGLEILRSMTADATLPPELLKIYVKELNEFKATENGLVNTLKMEYMGLTKMIAKGFPLELLGRDFLEEEDLTKMKIIKPGYFYKPNQTRRLFAESYRLMIERKLPELESRIELENRKLTSPIEIITPNKFGRELHVKWTIAFKDVFSRQDLENFSVAGTQIMLALKGYKTKTGQLPETLSELTPEYFPEIPKDPFDGKPIRYSSEKKIIYSSQVNLTEFEKSEKEGYEYMRGHIFKIEF